MPHILTTQSLVDVVAAAEPVHTLVRAPTTTVEQVRGVMTSELIRVGADELIAVVGRTMLTAGVGHVVVVDVPRAVGVVCLDDVIDALLA